MNYNYDGENREDAGYTAPVQPDTAPGAEPEAAAETAYSAEPQDTQPVTVSHTGPRTPTVTELIDDYADCPEQERSGAHSAGQARAETWREPVYSEKHESTTDMFSPGFCQKHDRFKRPEQRHSSPDGTPPRRRRGFIRAACLALACVLLSSAASYGVLEYRIKRGDLKPINQVVLGSAPGGQPSGGTASGVAATGEQMSAEDIYDMACSQVVGIKTEVSYSGGFFSQSGMTSSVTGSGFIISADGYILTNYHVIETAYENNLPLKVFLNDGTTYDAHVIGYEATNDFALIKIEAESLYAAAIANSDNIRVGERVYAVGNPFGELVYTMTEGIISALDRVVTVDNKSISTFQLSAAVNSGNSGGPVYNSSGEVVGIVTAKFMSSAVEGIGFAIPINDAVEFATELIANGYITGRAYIGITVETVTSSLAGYFNWVEGAYVKTVQEGSAADRAGLKVGDVITMLGENEVTSTESLLYAKKMFQAGDTTTIRVKRGGEDVELTITFDEDMSAGQAQQTQQPAQQQPQTLPRVAPGG